VIIIYWESFFVFAASLGWTMCRLGLLQPAATPSTFHIVVHRCDINATHELTMSPEDRPLSPSSSCLTTFAVQVGTRGRGLFATGRIPPRTCVHKAPCILISPEDYQQHFRFTILEHYLFNIKRSDSKLLALGYGSLFNHSNRPNVDYRVVVSTNVQPQLQPPTTSMVDYEIHYYSGHHCIEQGDELCISYGSDLWFENTEECTASVGSSSEEENDAQAFLGKIDLDNDS
jgi:hypothetical protein